MISANSFRNACVKKIELQKKNRKSLSFGEFFSSWKGVGFVVTLEAANYKVTRKHMFFFTLTHFLDNNLRNKKNI